MIRYLWVDALTVIFFFFYLFEFAKDISISSAYLMMGIGCCLATPIAFILSKLISRKLIKNQSSFLDRTPPGGVWFFLLVGAVFGLLIFIVEMIGGRTIASEIIVACLSFLSVLFTILGIYIFILERKHNKKIYIGVQGFVFREREP